MAEDRRTETADTVRRLADLAGLRIDDARARTLAAEFEDLERDLRLMRRVDLTGVDPAPSRTRLRSA